LEGSLNIILYRGDWDIRAEKKNFGDNR